MKPFERMRVTPEMVEEITSLEGYDPKFDGYFAELQEIPSLTPSERRHHLQVLEEGASDLYNFVFESPFLRSAFSAVNRGSFQPSNFLTKYREVQEELALIGASEKSKELPGVDFLDAREFSEVLSSQLAGFRERTAISRDLLAGHYIGYPYSMALDHADGSFPLFEDRLGVALEAFFRGIDSFNPFAKTDISLRLHKRVRYALETSGSDLIDSSRTRLTFDPAYADGVAFLLEETDREDLGCDSEEFLGDVAPALGVLDPHGGACDIEASEAVDRLMEGLSTREKQVVTLLYGPDGNPLTPSEVASQLRLTPQYISQIVIQARAKTLPKIS